MEKTENTGLHSIKIVSKEEAISIAKRLHTEGKRIVTTNGCFDILHVGHIRNLGYAKSLGDVLIVGINSDASVRENKGPTRPVVSETERAEMLAAVLFVDHVFIFDDATPIPWLEELRPHVHVKGSDRTIDNILERDVVVQHGGEIVLFPHTGKHSTTGIIERILGTH